LRLSKRTEYGLRAIVQLAKLWPTHYVQSRDLSKQENLPNKFLESILLALRRGGFLESKVGSGGGYRLSRAPREILVGDVIRRLEGRLSARDTAVPPRDTAPGEIACHLVNQRLTDATDKVLDNITLEELLDEVNKHAGTQQEMYYI
jgi:Rrf2 family protein